MQFNRDLSVAVVKQYRALVAQEVEAKRQRKQEQAQPDHTEQADAKDPKDAKDPTEHGRAWKRPVRGSSSTALRPPSSPPSPARPRPPTFSDLFGANVNQGLIMGQMSAIANRSRMVNGVPTSLCDLGYCDVGLDDK